MVVSNQANGLDYVIRMWGLREGKEILVEEEDAGLWRRLGLEAELFPTRGNKYRRLTSLAVENTTDHPLLAAGASGPFVYIWDFGTRELVRTLVADDSFGTVTSIAFCSTANGIYLVGGTVKGALLFWDLGLGQSPASSVLIHTRHVHVASIDWAGEKVIASGALDGVLCLWKPDGSAIARIRIDAAITQIMQVSEDTTAVVTGKGRFALKRRQLLILQTKIGSSLKSGGFHSSSRTLEMR